jgi:DNA primase
LTAAAIGLRDLLSELGGESWVKTSGSKGFLVVVPLDGSAVYGDGGVAHAAGTLQVRRAESRRPWTENAFRPLALHMTPKRNIAPGQIG